MKVLNGTVLKRMYISAANNLFNHYPQVDALNVFPVPDGDTGTNMNLTITSGVNQINNLPSDSVEIIAKEFSRGLLMGARGNSGVITSQIFRGFAMPLIGKTEINLNDLVQAFKSAKDIAYRAVMKPVEGTILTIIREVSEVLTENQDKLSSIKQLFELVVKEANESLARTPNLLPILREVGVVDSGGAGLCYIFEGMKSALEGKIIERNSDETISSPTVSEPFFAGSKLENDEFGYCTEFILELSSSNSDKRLFNEKKFTNVLKIHGDSLVVVRDENIVKVHVHTLHPGAVLTYAERFGDFVTLKIENMQRQHQNLENGVSHKISVIGPKEKYALIAVSSGEGISSIFNEYGVGHIIKGGQTMNPSTEDFINEINKCNAENIFILPNNSNIILAAEQARDLTTNAKVFVIETKTIPQGFLAAMTFSNLMDPLENAEEMNEAIKMVKTGSVTKAVRDTTMNGVLVKEGDYIAIDGKSILVSGLDLMGVTKKLIQQMLNEESSICTIIYGEDTNKIDINDFKDFLEKEYPDIQFEIKEGKQPVYPFIVGVE